MPNTFLITEKRKPPHFFFRPKIFVSLSLQSFTCPTKLYVFAEVLTQMKRNWSIPGFILRSLGVVGLSFNFSFAQPGQWTWMKGDSIFNSAGNYGTMGVPHPANQPPARYSPTRWKDLEGNFWIYGGYGPEEFLGDMWKYDVSTNEWTWIFGTPSTNLPAYYGTLGIPSINNFPGCRGWGGASWADAQGDLWMFGGKGYGENPNAPKMLADLWRYNIQSNKWTWMKGNSDDTTHYGLLQIQDAMNTPGSRMEVTANWVDSTGFWFYGGTSNNKLKNDCNDMWRFDLPTNNWVWMSGDTIVNVLPNLGSQYVFSSSNTPGGRFAHCAWQSTDGKFWMFGGHNDLIGDDWADLWQYDPVINQWAFFGGSIDSTLGNNGAVCDTSQHFYPKGRWENRLAWIDDCDNLWLFGGQRNVNSLNDLWVYSISKKIWSYVGGTLFTNDGGYYGIQGIADFANLPPSRMGSGAWRDDAGNFWLLGGSKTTGGAMLYSDLWKYTSDSACPAGISCNIPTAVEEGKGESEEDVLIYPNPSDGSFIVEIVNGVSGDGVSIDVLNTFGQKVFSCQQKINGGAWSVELHSEKKEMDLRSRNASFYVSASIYFIEIKTKNDLVRKKIIIVK